LDAPASVDPLVREHGQGICRRKGISWSAEEQEARGQATLEADGAHAKACMRPEARSLRGRCVAAGQRR
jgi:hypothetical protein